MHDITGVAFWCTISLGWYFPLRTEGDTGLDIGMNCLESYIDARLVERIFFCEDSVFFFSFLLRLSS